MRPVPSEQAAKAQKYGGSGSRASSIPKQTADFLTNYETMSILDMRLAFKVTWEGMRKNHFQHMHSRPVPESPSKKEKGPSNSMLGQPQKQGLAKETSGAKVQSQLDMREDGKVRDMRTRTHVRNTISSKDHLRSPSVRDSV